MNPPVVLDEARKVSTIRVWNKEWLSGLAAAQRDREEQIVIIDLAVAVAIEVWKVFDHFNASRLEHAQIKIRIDALNLAAQVQSMIAADDRDCVAKLETALFSPLRHAKRGAVLDAGKGKLRPGSYGLDVVKESAETEVKTIHCTRI